VKFVTENRRLSMQSNNCS